MKKKNLRRNLFLNKETITNLKSDDLQNLKGGYITHTCNGWNTCRGCGGGGTGAECYIPPRPTKNQFTCIYTLCD